MRFLAQQRKKILRGGLLLIFLFLGLGAAQPVRAQTPAPQNPAIVYFFWGDGCPHCAKEKPFLESLSEKYPSLELRMYEVWNNADNQDLFTVMAAKFGFEPSGVPTLFIGDSYLVGYTEDMNDTIEAAIQQCVEQGCADAGAGVLTGSETLSPTPTPLPGATATPSGNIGETDQITLPIIGTVDLAGQSLTVSTLLISFIDGFNPCSLWVLSMLLALTLHTGSRKKVVIIGLIFLTVTAGVYALFIAGLFTIFTFTSFLGWIQAVVAVVAIFFATVNIKDYFWYQEGLSFTIADEKKTGIAARMRRLMNASQSFWGLAGGTVILAAGVSLVEFSCTAGFPVLWTNILAAQNVPALTFILLLLLYLLIYQLDELAIFFTAVFTLKASRLEEKQGRILKLIGGMLMLALGISMLVNPNLMNSLSSSLIIFGAAFGATLLVLLLHRKILPAFGIYIGTQEKSARRPRKGTGNAKARQ